MCGLTTHTRTYQVQDHPFPEVLFTKKLLHQKRRNIYLKNRWYLLQSKTQNLKKCRDLYCSRWSALNEDSTPCVLSTFDQSKANLIAMPNMQGSQRKQHNTIAVETVMLDNLIHSLNPTQKSRTSLDRAKFRQKATRKVTHFFLERGFERKKQQRYCWLITKYQRRKTTGTYDRNPSS